MTSSVVLNEQVLYVIFTMVNEQQKYPVGDELSLDTRSPWNMAGVCKDWRRAICANPSFWTRFELNATPGPCSSRTKCHHDVDLTRCQRQLELSQPLPLTLYLFHTRRCAPLFSLVRALGEHAQRWQDAYVYLPQLEVDDEVGIQFAGLLPCKPGPHFANLRSLEHLAGGDAGPGAQLGPAFTSGSLPKLITLRITHYSPPSPLDTEMLRNSPRYPWSRLQELELCDYNDYPEDLLNVLQQCSGLGSFTLTAGSHFDGDNNWYDNVSQRGSVVMKSLITLDVTLPCCIWEGTYETLHALSLPNLQNFRFSGVSHPWDHPTNEQDFSRLLAHWGCKLRYFEMDAPRQAENDYGEGELWFPSFLHLDVFEELEQLVLTNDCWQWATVELEEDSDQESPSPDSVRPWRGAWQFATCDDILQRLMNSVDGHAPLFPKVKVLRMNDTRFDPYLLLDVTRERTAQGEGSDYASLRRVEIDYFVSNTSENRRFQQAQSEVVDEYAKALTEGLATTSETHSQGARPSLEVVYDPRRFETILLANRVSKPFPG
ncbi:hypothetical protein BDV98DRAFT_561494 [Pterulicium gracile]|uniref:F-box domain-containing protein n=1 Tax=Pterulicium gracile TaxID=1884261 RepID=A0A5C3QX31_9AGAR|nr:hypothetical protein BDV98DRAFT_561494 [Pterula gracilis]